MNQIEYRNAYRYASKFTTEYLDVVHDAYLYYKRTEDKDLFDEPNPVIIKQVRRQYNRNVGTNRYRIQWRGEKFPTKHYSFSDDDTRDIIENVFGVHTDIVSSIHTGYTISKLKEKLTDRQKYVFDLTYQGYNGTEIAKMDGINKSSVNKSIRLIREKANYIIN
jgi:DNA-binding NarL/FixJ family response regulator